jgi:hypothetical protein
MGHFFPRVQLISFVSGLLHAAKDGLASKVHTRGQKQGNPKQGKRKHVTWPQKPSVCIHRQK